MLDILPKVSKLVLELTDDASKHSLGWNITRSQCATIPVHPLENFLDRVGTSDATPSLAWVVGLRSRFNTIIETFVFILVAIIRIFMIVSVSAMAMGVVVTLAHST